MGLSQAWNSLGLRKCSTKPLETESQFHPVHGELIGKVGMKEEAGGEVAGEDRGMDVMVKYLMCKPKDLS